MLVLAANEGKGVQVKTVLPTLQEGVTACGEFPGEVTNVALVALVFIAVLNVNTTFVVVDTPVALFAGTTETSVGCATALEIIAAKNNPNQICARAFIMHSPLKLLMGTPQAHRQPAG
jgi:hypothetical protein